MPSKKRRPRRRRRDAGALPLLIAVLLIVAAALTVMLVQSDPLAEKEPAVTLQPGQANYVDARQATAAPLVLGSEEKQTATPVPTATPAPTATPEPVNGGNRFIPAPEEGAYFLPVFDRALRTPDDEAMIAITIDECDDPMVLERMVSIARRYDAKLTLFPSGDALMDETMQEGFRTCVRQLGYELENYSFNKKAEYKLTDGELALQLWKQGIAASYCMGADYTQHFSRPVYKGSSYDQRTHFFLNKLNLLGVASYSHSYSELRMENLTDTLENGKIYQFDMSEKSLKVYEAFIAAASAKGYRLVTMNELFGLENNRISSTLTIDQQQLPDISDYQPMPYDLKLNYRTRAVFDLQERLMELGYLDPEENKADGLYGPNTSIAVSAFQAKVGIPATGNAGVDTQQELNLLDAPRADE